MAGAPAPLLAVPGVDQAASAGLPSPNVLSPQQFHRAPVRPMKASAIVILGVLQVLMFIMYGLVAEYGALAKGPANAATDVSASAHVEEYYPFFQHVAVMIYVGFGFLMTFPHGFSLSAVGFNMLVSVFVMQWGMLTGHFWHCVFEDHWVKMAMDLPKLITGLFSAAATLITMGGLLGKTGPVQLVVVGFLQMLFFSLNENILVHEYKMNDTGGSMVVHAFGAFFGVAASYVLSRGHGEGKAIKNMGAEKWTDVFAMVGTIFLFMYWPSFNSALQSGNAKHRAIINTVLALASSGLTAFFCSAAMRNRRFSMVDVQNATLAGGVAMGTSCDIIAEPWGALLLGSAAGILSVVGYTKIQPFLEEKFGLHDTCGILNLHGMPGVLGGIAGAIAMAGANSDNYGYDVTTIMPGRADGRSASSHAGWQMAALGTTLAISIAGGFIVGHIVKALDGILDPPTECFEDKQYWDGEEEEVFVEAEGEIAKVENVKVRRKSVLADIRCLLTAFAFPLALRQAEPVLLFNLFIGVVVIFCCGKTLIL